uniref:Uncharacterized protein n=1 Tax=Clytia hemisphaerica TaxID=252671 RepID=A0A7M5VFK2_9CNID
MSDIGLGQTMLWACGICALICTFGPFFSKYYLAYILMSFASIVLVTEILSRLLRKEVHFRKRIILESSLPESKKRPLKKQHNHAGRVAKRSITQKMTHLCSRALNSPSKVQLSPKRPTRKVNRVTTTSVIKTMLNQVRTPSKKTSLTFFQTAKKLEWKRRSYHLSMEELRIRK